MEIEVREGGPDGRIIDHGETMRDALRILGREAIIMASGARVLEAESLDACMCQLDIPEAARLAGYEYQWTPLDYKLWK